MTTFSEHPLHDILSQSDAEIISFFASKTDAEKEELLNKPYQVGETQVNASLHQACYEIYVRPRENPLALFTLLLDLGADPNVIGGAYRAPSFVSVLLHAKLEFLPFSLPIAELLLAKSKPGTIDFITFRSKCDPFNIGKWIEEPISLLAQVARSSSSSYVNDCECALQLTTFLMDHGASINQTTSSGFSESVGIQEAVKNGMYDVFMLYMKRGAHVTSSDSYSLETLATSAPNESNQLKLANLKKITQTLKALFSSSRSFPSARVTIHSAENLKAADRNGLSDPYVELRLNPSSKKPIFKTSVIKETLNPVWNETRTISDLYSSCYDGFDLFFHVWDKDLLGRDFLGEAVLTFPGTPNPYFYPQDLSHQTVELRPRNPKDVKITGKLNISISFIGGENANGAAASSSSS